MSFTARRICADVATTESEAMSPLRAPNPINSRVQDLFLLAKLHYQLHDAMRWSEYARRIVAIHNLYDVSRMSLKDAAHVVLSDLFPIIKKNFEDARGFTEFVMRLGHDPVCGLNHGNHPDGFHAGLIEAVLTQVQCAKVRENEQWLMPFPQPAADPLIQALLDADNPTRIEAIQYHRADTAEALA